VTRMKKVDRPRRSDGALKSNNKPAGCYCSALPKGSALCMPCYTKWLAAGARKQSGPAVPAATWGAIEQPH
jgi:hypothetical protein